MRRNFIVIAVILFSCLYFWSVNSQVQNEDSDKALTGIVEKILAAVHDEDAATASSFFLGDEALASQQAEFLVESFQKLKARYPNATYQEGFQVCDDELAFVGIYYERTSGMIEIDAMFFLKENDTWKAGIRSPTFTRQTQASFDANQRKRLAGLFENEYKTAYHELDGAVRKELGLPANPTAPVELSNQAVIGVWQGATRRSLLGLKLLEDNTAYWIQITDKKMVRDFSGTWTLNNNALQIVDSESEYTVVLDVQEISRTKIVAIVDILENEKSPKVSFSGASDVDFENLRQYPQYWEAQEKQTP